ncbi:MAG: hypothetical protein IPK32_05870 [Verrucomicrobiaceae bacterium]|nr:hypothetical protein [Verrucomicrobiaceae bacterium]
MSATLADILQDARAFAAACEELAEHLEATATRIKAPGLESQEMAFLRVLPLMCAFASPEAMAAFAAHLRGLAARLDALPASADDLAKVMTAPAAEFEAFEALLFNDRHMAIIPGEERRRLHSGGNQKKETPPTGNPGGVDQKEGAA